MAKIHIAREQFLFLPGIYQFLLNLIGKEEKISGE